MEIMLTAILVFIVLMAAVELSASHAAFAIGFVILIDIMAGYVKIFTKFEKLCFLSKNIVIASTNND